MEMGSNHKTKTLITIDTEFSIGGHFENNNLKPVSAERHIYCKIGGKEYGINLIMDILERYSHRGVFFVETEARFYFGEREILNIIESILNRGHEVQLHVHPNFDSFLRKKRLPDDMRTYSIDEQVNIIGDALAFLSSYGIDSILAYRCGGFYCNLDTIEALRRNNIRYSSNYNIAFPNCDYVRKFRLRNDIFCIAGVFEVPITCYREFPIRKRWNSLQVGAASFEEIEKSMFHYFCQGVKVVTIITHPFEFVRSGDLQYSKMSPKRFVAKRFENICRFLATNTDKYEVITYNDLDNLIKMKKIAPEEKVIEFYKSSMLNTLKRYFENVIFTRLEIWNG